MRDFATMINKRQRSSGGRAPLGADGSGGLSRRWRDRKGAASRKNEEKGDNPLESQDQGAASGAGRWRTCLESWRMEREGK